MSQTTKLNQEGLPWDSEPEPIVLEPTQNNPVTFFPMDPNQLVRVEPGPILKPAPVTGTMEMIAQAVASGNLEMVSRLMDLQERFDANEARKAFVSALSAFKANPPELLKNRHVSFVNSKNQTVAYDHSSLDLVSSEIGKALSAHGLSHRWDVKQDEKGRIKVTCFLQHSLGHSESVSLESGADDSGSKNNIQAVGSTISYLQRYTLLAITGMATKDQDDDGAASGKGEERMAESIFQEHLAAIKNAGSHKSLMLAFTVAFTEAQVTKNKEDQKLFIQARNARKAILDTVPS